MSILTALTGGKTAQDIILNKFANQARSQGVRQVLITILEEDDPGYENGSFDAKIINEKSEVITTETKNFLTKFYNENKPKF